MSDSKPEKVEITIGKKPDSKKTKPASKKAPSTPEKDTKKEEDKQPEQKPEIINFRHKRAGKTDTTDTDKDNADQDKKDEPNLWQRGGHRVDPDGKQDSDSSSKTGLGHAVLDHPDVKNLDGGFAADMYPPGHTVAPEKKEKQSGNDESTEEDKTPKEEPKAKPEDEAVDEIEEESEDKEEGDPTAGFTEDDAVYAHDEDFYSSKFNPDQPEKNRRGSHHGRSGRGKRPWLLFGLFLLTAAAGLAVLYYLENQEAGSGLIFDLIEQISIW